jgi:hypothetical protein
MPAKDRIEDLTPAGEGNVRSIKSRHRLKQLVRGQVIDGAGA